MDVRKSESDWAENKMFADRNHTNNIGKLLMNMQRDNFLCDIALKVRKSDKVVMAHKSILAANSTVLYDSIRIAEANIENSEPHYLELTIDTDCMDALEFLLQFMYTGELHLNPYILEDVLTLSENLIVDGVAQLCSSYIQELTNISNWMWLNHIANKYSMGDETTDKLQQFAKENFVFLVQTNELLSVDRDSLVDILTECNSENDGDIEVSKLEMILKWIENRDERARSSDELLKCLNKDILSQKNLHEVFEKYEAMIVMLRKSTDMWNTFLIDMNNIAARVKNRGDMKQKCNIHTSDNSHESQHQDSDGLLTNDSATWNYKSENESDNTLPYEREFCELEDNELTDDMLDTEHCKNKPNRRKASNPVRLNTSKKRRKKNIGSSRTHKKRPNLKTSSKILMPKKPRTKTSFTQVNLKELIDELDDAEAEHQPLEEINKLNAQTVPVPLLKDEAATLDEVAFEKDPEKWPNSSSEDGSPQKTKRIRTKKATSESEMYSCEKCPRKFLTPSSLKHHMKGHGANQPFLCEVCGFSTIHFASMNVHKRQHYDQLRFHCSYDGCNYTAVRRSRLEDHMSAHLGIKNHVCSVCGKAFSGRKHLHRHEQIHKGDKLKCAECPYDTPRRDKLREHIKKHHPETAVMHGFITAEDFNKPKPPPKPRKPRPLKDKRKLKVGMSEELMPANINMPITVAVQLRDDRTAEDQKAAEAIEQHDCDHGDMVLSPLTTSIHQQVLPSGGVIQVPAHLMTSMTNEEIIQYITNMTACQPSGLSQQQTTTIHTIIQSPDSPVSVVDRSTGHSPAVAQHVNQDGVIFEQKAENMTGSALSLSPATVSVTQSEQQQQWYNYQM